MGDTGNGLQSQKPVYEENVAFLTEAKFKTFTPKEICDATKSTEVLVCLSLESRDKVDEMVRNAVAAGGTTDEGPLTPSP